MRGSVFYKTKLTTQRSTIKRCFPQIWTSASILNDILPAFKGGVSPRRMTYKQSLRFYQKQSLRFYQKQSLRFYQKQSLRFYQKQSLTLFAHFQSSIHPHPAIRY